MKKRAWLYKWAWKQIFHGTPIQRINSFFFFLVIVLCLPAIATIGAVMFVGLDSMTPLVVMPMTVVIIGLIVSAAGFGMTLWLLPAD